MQGSAADLPHQVRSFININQDPCLKGQCKSAPWATEMNLMSPTTAHPATITCRLAHRLNLKRLVDRLPATFTMAAPAPPLFSLFVKLIDSHGLPRVALQRYGRTTWHSPPGKHGYVIPAVRAFLMTFSSSLTS